ncbi:MAG: sigma-54-dependent Fis family transcriptional regulator [Deltaproteobacteria bacterium]|nr:sigma-54-dependent Fis family transcriptional regulator [Deltaproteobacteria bacterium]
MGYRVMLVDGKSPILDSIQKLSPCLLVSEVNGGPDSFLDRFAEIRSKYPDLPMIVISPHPSIDEAVQAIKLGITDYIPVSALQERLGVTIEAAIKYNHANRAGQHHQPKPQREQLTPIAVNPAMVRALSLGKKIASTRSTVLIQGESGTGKEVVARYIHTNSDRGKGPFIAVNCAALPENLLESELFGHERGAFTGAVTRKKGKFELANGGTLLLDEISEMAVSIQAKLLRVLQEREIDRVGGQYAIPVDARVIATTNRDLESETKNGNFRLDLFYRLNVVPLSLPPLRQRIDDITPLARAFLKNHSAFNGVAEKKLTPEAETFLKAKAWPGNVRELENLMERATLLVDPETIDAKDLEAISIPEGHEDFQGMDHIGFSTLKEMEKKMIFQALDNNEGNRTHAAKVLGISVRTLRNKLHEYQDELDEQ